MGMATFSEIEEWLSTLGAGIAGLHLLREYGIRTSELEYFIENFGKSRMSVSAFAPPPLKNQYEPILTKTETKLRSGLENILHIDVSNEEIDEALKDIRELYSLLRDIHQATISGLIVV